MVYFDNAATTFPKPQVVYDTIMDSMVNYGANPGRSGHKLALKASRGVFETRQLLSKFFNTGNPMNIIFTFNCTESLNIAIKGVLKSGDHVITTSMEHNSVLRPIEYLKRIGVESTIVSANSQGLVDPKDIENAIKPNTKLIVTTHVSNLVGSILPIEEIGAIAKKHNVYYLVDGAQSAGVYDIDVKKMNIDMLAFPGHKGLLGPQGTGGLYISEELDIDSIFQGGTGSESSSMIQPSVRPDKFESGTINAPGVIGLGEGIRFIMEKGIENIKDHEEELAKYFIDQIKNIEEIKIYGPLTDRQGPVVSINVKDIDSSEISYILDDKYNIAVRPGLHCAPLAHKTIGTLNQGTVRFSFGMYNTFEEIDYAVKALKEIVKDL
ncbi:MAG: aminotransferase class V-fold PLP-dependent enzyme [Tissierellaceae bacterium]|nr:aminotransferase class V-fold PLP-dependent enzyme [Tissierellaceae bacterium]